MKRIHFFNIMLIFGVVQLCIFLVGCGGTEKKEETYSDGKIKLRYYVKEIDGNFLKHGMYRTWYQDGMKAEEIEYEKGKKNGKYISWHKNGTKKDEIEYENDKKNGKYISWYENGTKYKELEYENDKENGKYNLWSSNGTKCEQGQFIDGIRDGKWFSWHSDGRKESIANYNKGTIDGKIALFDNEKECSVNFKNGLLHGQLEANYNDDRCNLEIIASFKNGIPVGNFFITNKDKLVIENSMFSMEGRFTQGSNIQIDKMTNVRFAGDRLLAGGFWHDNLNEFFYSHKGIGALWDQYQVGYFTELLPKLKNCIAETE